MKFLPLTVALALASSQVDARITRDLRQDGETRGKPRHHSQRFKTEVVANTRTVGTEEARSRTKHTVEAQGRQEGSKPRTKSRTKVGTKETQERQESKPVHHSRTKTERGNEGRTNNQDELAKLKEDYMLLADADLPRQYVGASGNFEANGRTYSTNDLQPLNVFSSDATITVDGQPQPLEDDSERSRLFMTKGESGETILVSKEGGTKDIDGQIKSIDVLSHDGSEVYMQALSDGSLVSIRREDVDTQKTKGFAIGGIRGGEDEVFEDAGIENRNRKLQEGCSSYKVVEVAIAYDSSFCSQVAQGSPNTARSVVEEAIARASLLFEEICIRVRLSHLEGHCSADQDPYRAAMATNDIGCSGARGALQMFGEIWETSRSHIHRDTAHLFFGTDFPGGTIGCANTPALCNHYSYGANEMSSSTTPIFRGNLFAHELGHNMGSPHVSDPNNSGNFLMEPYMNTGSSGVSLETTTFIHNYVNQASCVATELDGEPGGTTSSPPSDPIPGPTSGDGNCTNHAGWVDSFNDGCDYYDENPQDCVYFSDDIGTDGLSPGQACCDCDGVVDPDDDDGCTNYAGWVDSDGYGCNIYAAIPGDCVTYSHLIGTAGLSPGQACCVCDGV